MHTTDLTAAFLRSYARPRRTRLNVAWVAWGLPVASRYSASVSGGARVCFLPPPPGFAPAACWMRFGAHISAQRLQLVRETRSAAERGEVTSQ